MTIPHWIGAAAWWLACGIAAVLCGLILAGCAGPYTLTKDADLTQAVITVEWSTPGRITQLCGSSAQGTVLGCYIEGRIIMGKPAGWGDERALLTLGHEVFHALGARHDF